MGGIDGEALDLHHLLHGPGQFLCFLERHRLRNGDGDRDVVFNLLTLLDGVLHHEQQAVANGNYKGAGGNLESVEGLTVAQIGHGKGKLGGGLIVAIEDHIDAVCLGHLFPNCLGIGFQGEAVNLGRGGEDGRALGLAGVLQILGGGRSGDRGVHFDGIRGVRIRGFRHLVQFRGESFGRQRGLGAQRLGLSPEELVFRVCRSCLRVKEIGFYELALFLIAEAVGVHGFRRWLLLRQEEKWNKQESERTATGLQITVTQAFRLACSLFPRHYRGSSAKPISSVDGHSTRSSVSIAFLPEGSAEHGGTGHQPRSGP